MDNLLLQALREDISDEDVTTNSVMRAYKKGEAQLICKEDGIIAGMDVFHRVFELLEPEIQIEKYDFRWCRGEKRRYSCCGTGRYAGDPFRRTDSSQLSSAE